MTAAKQRAAKSPGGKGPVAKRPAGLKNHEDLIAAIGVTGAKAVA